MQDKRGLPYILSSLAVGPMATKLVGQKTQNGFKSVTSKETAATKVRRRQERDEAPLKFFVGEGNNRELVVRLMRKRRNWEELSKSHLDFQFKWQQSSKLMRYDLLDNGTLGYKKVYNHIEFHEELTTKDRLFRNLRRYCSAKGLPLYLRIPVTFELPLKEGGEGELASFCRFFLKHHPLVKSNRQERKQKIVEFRRLIGKYPVPFPGGRKLKLPECLKPELEEAFKSRESYLWIFKPTSQNRGRGVKLFSSLEELAQLILAQGQKEDFVIQKYMERPMLIYGRKFDVRMWALLDHNALGYLFPEGYIRTSASPFSTLSKDAFVHLTNNAIQKHSPHYGRFESGNQLSFDEFDEYCKANCLPCSKEALQTKAEQLVVESLLSVAGLLNRNSKRYCFELMGYDFLVGENGGVWLLEVNTNPCLEESSPVLKALLGPMMDGVLRLTVDRVLGCQADLESGPKWKYLDTQGKDK